MKLPPARDYAPPTGRYFSYVWDTTGIPLEQERDGTLIVTPPFENLHVYGREVDSIYAEDEPRFERLRERGRTMGQWFSVACPEGELGSMALTEIKEISEDDFSAAYERAWKP